MQSIRLLAQNVRPIVRQTRNLHVSPVFRQLSNQPTLGKIQTIPEPYKIMYRRIGWVTAAVCMADYTYFSIKKMPDDVKADEDKKAEYIAEEVIYGCMVSYLLGRLCWPFYYALKASSIIMHAAS